MEFDGPPLPAPYPPAYKLRGFIQDVLLAWPREFRALRRAAFYGFRMIFLLSLLRIDYAFVLTGFRFLAIEIFVYLIFGLLSRDRQQFVRLPQRALANGVFYLALKYVTTQFVSPGFQELTELAPDWRIIGWLLQFPALYLTFAYKFAAYKAIYFVYAIIVAWL